MDICWMPIVLVAEVDAAAAGCLVDLVRPVVVSGDGALDFRDMDGAPIGPAQGLPGDVLCFMAFSKAALGVHAGLMRHWPAHFGAGSGPALNSLVAEKAPEAAASAVLVRRLVQSLHQGHQSKAQLMREIALLRRDHDSMQSAFASLEAYFHSILRSERNRTMVLTPDTSLPPLRLNPGDEIEQRLPTDSTGLSDVEICLRGAPTSQKGALRLSLELLEQGESVAEWQIAACDLSTGWLRLSLVSALGPDAQTAVLRLIWEGESPLLLEPSLLHPDPRFAPSPGAPMLALHLWKFVPGAQAALPVDGHPAQPVSLHTEWNIGLSALRVAHDATGDQGAVEYSDLRTGLFVRPKDAAIVAARLDGAGRPGMMHIFGGVKTEQETGPDVEYAYALAPVGQRSHRSAQLPQFDAGQISDWLRLPPNTWQELHLFLEKPLAEPHDLYLLSRVAGKHPGRSRVDACFFRIVGQTVRATTE